MSSGASRRAQEGIVPQLHCGESQWLNPQIILLAEFLVPILTSTRHLWIESWHTQGVAFGVPMTEFVHETTCYGCVR
jgi:hypothetical protein